MARTKRTAKSIRRKKDPGLPQGLLLRGSLIEFRRRCGKAGCHCRKGELHSSPALSYSQEGKTHILTLAREDVPGVKAALRRYHQARRRLEGQAMGGIKELQQRIRRRRQSQRRAG